MGDYEKLLVRLHIVNRIRLELLSMKNRIKEIVEKEEFRECEVISQDIFWFLQMLIQFKGHIDEGSI